MHSLLRFFLFSLFVVVCASSLEAHPHHDHSIPEFAHPNGLLSGFLHPLCGMDHLLAMFAVGIVAAQAGGRFLWLGPATFLAGVGVGGMLGLAHVGIPSVEMLVALSLISMGLVLTLKKTPRRPVLYAAFILFGFVHGHAHGMEVPNAVQGMAYMFGFLVGSMLLHVVGVAFGLFFKKFREIEWANPVRLSGAAIAATGLILIVSGQ